VNKDPVRYINWLESVIASAKRELERFADSSHPDDLVKTAERAKRIYVDQHDTNVERSHVLLAVSEALLPFSMATEGTIVDKARLLVERWQTLEDENVRLRAKLQEIWNVVEKVANKK
jgi:hypothetical protein